MPIHDPAKLLILAVIAAFSLQSLPAQPPVGHTVVRSAQGVDVNKVKIGFCDLLRRRSPKLGAACAVAEWGVRGAIKLAEAYGYHELAEAIRKFFDQEYKNQRGPGDR